MVDREWWLRRRWLRMVILTMRRRCMGPQLALGSMGADGIVTAGSTAIVDSIVIVADGVVAVGNI